MTEQTKKITIRVDDGIYSSIVAEGEIALSVDKRQMMTDIAALLRQGAAAVEVERDRAFPESEPVVKAGQVWADNDKRSEGRKVRILSVGETHAVVEQYVPRGSSAKPGRQTQIRLDRFRPTSTGYRLVQDVEGQASHA